MNDKKLIDFTLWLFAVCVLAILVTSCNPYVVIPTPTATATKEVSSYQADNLTPIPHYWQLAALDPWRPGIEVANRKAGH